MPFAEALHHRGEQQVDHGRDADLQRAAAQVGGLAQLFGQLAHGFQHLQTALVHDPAGVGGAGGVAVPDQQRGARFLFQLPDHFADGRLRHEQRLGRLREAGMPDGFDEIPQCAHVHGPASPSRGARKQANDEKNDWFG
ncbi:hypothetical protein D9M68_749340 [compost metagenome]